MTYHKINNENNSTNIDQFVNQTEFNERMSVTNMVSWAEWTTLVYGLLIISVEILQVIIKNSS
jgi:guanylate kinase